MDADWWKAGDPIYVDPRHVFDEHSYERQIVRRMFDVFDDHKEACGLCAGLWSGTKASMTVTFEKEAA